MATWFQQKIEEAQESGFHSRVWKSCVFRVLTFQADPSIYIPFCSILSSSSPSSLGVSHLVHTLISFSTHSLLHSCLLSQTVLVSPLGASLRSQDLPFLMCRQSSCLTKPGSPFKTVGVLFQPFPCSFVFPISPPFSALRSIHPVFSFSLAADPFFSPFSSFFPRNLSVPHVTLSYCFVCFSFPKV